MCEKFSHWLKGHEFTVWTDSNPLTYIMTKPKLDACEQRWVAKLAPYNFDLKRIPGSKNTVADALSHDPFAVTVAQRLMRESYLALLSEAVGTLNDDVQDAFRWASYPQEITSLTTAEVKAICQLHIDWECSMEMQAIQLGSNTQRLLSPGIDTLPELSHEELRDFQLQDSVTSKVIPFVFNKKRPTRRDRYSVSSKVLLLMKQWDRLILREGVLYRVIKESHTNRRRFQYVLPEVLRLKAMTGIHDLAGHQGQARTLALARQRFFWPAMERDIKEYVRCCQRCVLAKTPEPAARAPLESIKTCSPMELVCLDFWTAEDSKKNSVDVLVVTDHFTKLAHAWPCRNQTAKQVARKLWDHVFCVYGFASRIHTDQGANFESELIAELLKLSGVQKSRTTAYHPMGNGETERFNRTLGSMLRSLPLKTKEHWPEQIQSLTFAYNATVHETTGYAPFFLMFGRVPRLPVDVMFRNVLDDSSVVDCNKYVETLITGLKEAMSVAQRHTDKQQRRQGREYDKRVKGIGLSMGDRVLIANKGERGRRKLADKWNPEIFTVTSVNPQTHTYIIQDRYGREKVVHRNLLLQVNFLPFEIDDSVHFNDSDAAGPSINVDAGEATHSGDGLDREDMEDSGEESASWLAEDSSDYSELWTSDGKSDPEEPCFLEENDRGSTSEILELIPSNSPLINDLRPEPPLVTMAPSPVAGRTRAGRVVKPVKRLIESTHQKV